MSDVTNVLLSIEVEDETHVLPLLQWHLAAQGVGMLGDLTETYYTIEDRGVRWAARSIPKSM